MKLSPGEADLVTNLRQMQDQNGIALGAAVLEIMQTLDHIRARLQECEASRGVLRPDDPRYALHVRAGAAWAQFRAHEGRLLRAISETQERQANLGVGLLRTRGIDASKEDYTIKPDGEICMLRSGRWWRLDDRGQPTEPLPDEL